jgi:hypothetical protein
MDAESQAKIKGIAESGDVPKGEIIVVLGASDIAGAEVSAETVTSGDPSYTGPLAGVPLGLLFSTFWNDLKQFIPEAVYEENVGIWTMAADTEQIGERFKAIRGKVARG